MAEKSKEQEAGLTIQYIYEPSPEFVLYHYAVKRVDPFMQPACVSNREELRAKGPFAQGMTVNRGKVICRNCLRAMGNPDA